MKSLTYSRDRMESLVKSYAKNSHSMGSSYTIEVGDDPTKSDEVVLPSGCIQQITQQKGPRSSRGERSIRGQSDPDGIVRSLKRDQITCRLIPQINLNRSLRDKAGQGQKRAHGVHSQGVGHGNRGGDVRCRRFSGEVGGKGYEHSRLISGREQSGKGPGAGVNILRQMP